MIKLLFTFFIIILPLLCITGQPYDNFHNIWAEVDFSKPLREWDGFGVNYVQTAHTKDYTENPQEYGGFSILDENEKDEILEMIFGKDGLKPGLVKLFLDGIHQEKPGGPFDHESNRVHARICEKRT